MKRRTWLAAVVSVSLFATACSRDPQVAAREYEASGDAYVAQRKLEEATIEYRNSLKAAPSSAGVHYKLARAYEESGDPARAYAAYARSADLDPSNVDAQVKAGTLLLVAGEYEAARTRAELAIKAAPRNVPAHILLGNAMAGMSDTARAMEQIEEAIGLDPSYAPAWTSLGAMRFHGGQRAEAGEAFTRAIELAPKSADARLALANYQWAMGDVGAAERTLKSALEIDSGNSGAHRALALLYLTTRRAELAETHFKALTDQPGGRLALADYYIGTGRRDAAVGVLQEIATTSEKGAVRTARLRMAALEYATGSREKAHSIVDELLDENARDANAQIVKSRMLLQEGDPTGATEHARAAVTADSSSAAAHYALGVTAVARDELQEAEGEFRRVVEINPRAAAAQMHLARIQLARGDAGGALTAAEAAVKASPNDPAAAVLMSRTLRARGELDRAQRELAAHLSRQAGSAALHAEKGWLLLDRREPQPARAAFEEARRRDPEFFEARAGLTAVDLTEGRREQARSRIDMWLRASPDDVRLRTLSARVHLEAGEVDRAELALREIISSSPSTLEAYDLLGRIYVSRGQLDEALKEYRRLAERTPSAAGPGTMIGMILESRGDTQGARAEYERVLAAEPRAGVAANNLAWLYAENGRLDDAMRLAGVARDVLRDRPEPFDTMGWVYLKKGLPELARSSFEEAVSRAPRNPTYQYHLGLAHLRTGNVEAGRAALRRALASKPFAYAADAQKALDESARRP